MENEPLLPVNSRSEITNDDIRPGHREKIATVLESRRLHQTVITFITVDAVCVLADLTYTFLHDSCNGSEEDPEWLKAFSTVSLTITSLFLVEIPLTIYAFGIQFYNPLGSRLHSGLHFFDALVIIITFILEAVLRGKEQELAGLLVILRLWRLVKLVGGVAVGAGEINEETDKELWEAREKVKALQNRVQQLEEENTQLQTRATDPTAADL